MGSRPSATEGRPTPVSDRGINPDRQHVAIERYTYAGNREAHSAVTFARWLSRWAALRAQGWSVTVLHGGDHAVGLALYLGPEHAVLTNEPQQSLFAEAAS